MQTESTLIERIYSFLWDRASDRHQEMKAAIDSQISLLNRDSKYLEITTAFYIASSFNPLARLSLSRFVGIAPGVMTAYHFCRKIDDIADGDEALPQEYDSFSELVGELKESMIGEEYSDTPIGILLRGTVRDLKTFYGVDIREGISQFLDAMNYENERRINKIISTRAELSDLYDASFGVPQDISLICFRSKIRSNDIPELAALQGRLYAIRDLDDEIRRGIIFVPREILPQGMTTDELKEKYPSDPNVSSWIKEELNEGKQLIDKLKQRKLDFGAKIVVKSLVGGIERQIENGLMEYHV